jgi:hypothetical protein
LIILERHDDRYGRSVGDLGDGLGERPVAIAGEAGNLDGSAGLLTTLAEAQFPLSPVA